MGLDGFWVKGFGVDSQHLEYKTGGRISMEDSN